MTRSTKAMSLVLIGSAVVLGYHGCAHRQDDKEQNAHGQVIGGHHVGSHHIFIPASSGSGRIRGGGVSPGVSPRGGFGGIGHAAAGS